MNHGEGMAKRWAGRIVVWDTHPVQYRAPLYASIEREVPGRFHVIYESDSSVRGYHDRQFGRNVAWDLPLLGGYSHEFLSPLEGRARIHATLRRCAEIAGRMIRERPQASLHVGFDTPATAGAALAAALLGVRQILRVETQDAAFSRSPLKAAIRSLVWRLVYTPFAGALPIGVLNRDHLLRHGFRPGQLRFARYTVTEGVLCWSTAQKRAERDRLRNELGIPPDALVVGFCGKFIPKKDPLLLMAAMREFSRLNSRDWRLLMVGSGELEPALRAEAAGLGGRVIFPGFINQRALPAYYLAMDVFVLPSRREGETWGLVVNEALQAGCAVAVSDAVGCSADFDAWRRCHVFSAGNVLACSRAIETAARSERDFDWCRSNLKPYEMDEVARAMATSLGSDSSDNAT